MKKSLLLIMVAASILMSCEKDFTLEASMNETFYVRNGGSDMPIFMRGNGRSKTIIILLHGGPGDSSVGYMVKNFSQQLQEKYAFAFWDQRQQGNSHGQLNPENVSLPKIVEDLHVLVQALKLRYGEEVRLYLMGHSWGGAVGTAYLQTADYQGDISGFIEIDGGYDFPIINQEIIKMMNEIGQVEINNGNNIEIWQEMLDYANQLDLNDLSLKEVLKLNSYTGDITREKLLEDEFRVPSNRGFSEGSDAVSNSISVTMNALSIFIQKDLIEELIETSLTDELYKITVPTLLIWGKYDFKVPPRLGEIALEKLGSTEKTLKIYQHSGHSPMFYEPDLFVDDVIAFID